MVPCEQSGDHGTHEYLPPRAKTCILFIQCKVHANEKQGHPMDLFLKISVLQANFCWLEDLEEIICSGTESFVWKKIIVGV